MQVSEQAKASARLIVAAMHASDPSLSPVGDGGDDVLRASLEACINSLSLIPEEVEKCRALAAEATDEIERAAYLWQADLVRWQIEQAAGVAAERLLLFDSLKTEADFERERAKCAADTLYWFKMYAWGYDPRSVLKVQPFAPFPRQQDYLRWLDDTVVRRRKSGVVEKARDMGATVGALDWCAHKWLSVPGFSAFIVSSNEDLVDSSRDPDTLFEKIRFQLRLTPSWMLPRAFNLKRDMPYMNIVNPETGATITGGAPTENVGRQRRATVVLADEFQGWAGGGFKQNTSLSQTSPSVVKLGTPYGTFNQYFKDTHEKGANVFVMDWRDHPWKDERWYASLPFGYVSNPMTKETIAQEVDRNYEASQPGRVFPQFRDTHTVITISELRAYLKKYGIKIPDSGDSLARMPAEWGLGRANDRGATEAHRNGWLWAATPKQGHPLEDARFIFREWLAPIGSSLGEIARAVFDFERRDGEGKPERMKLSLNSHEAQGERDTYRKEYKLILHKWRTDYENGIAQLVDRFSLHDRDKPHPIRPQLMGRPKIYLVVADGQGELLPNGSGWRVQAAKDSAGLINLRRQIVGYHYPPEEQGKPAGLMRPRKIDDDLIDPLRAFAVHRFPAQPKLAGGEQEDRKLPAELQSATIAALPPEEQGRAHEAQQMYASRERLAERERDKKSKVMGGRFVNRYSFIGRR
jgi:hypothetical protein